VKDDVRSQKLYDNQAERSLSYSTKVHRDQVYAEKVRDFLDAKVDSL
jgi:hypothetical protein